MEFVAGTADRAIGLSRPGGEGTTKQIGVPLGFIGRRVGVGNRAVVEGGRPALAEGQNERRPEPSGAGGLGPRLETIKPRLNRGEFPRGWFGQAVARLARRRRKAIKPPRPMPRSAIEAGSGTAAAFENDAVPVTLAPAVVITS